MSVLIARLLAIPRGLLIGAAALVALGTHTAAYYLGGAHQFRAGFAAGESAAHARQRAEEARLKSRQLKDRLNAEIASPVGDADDGLRCGPSARDCPQ